jgi:hypothetical protein
MVMPQQNAQPVHAKGLSVAATKHIAPGGAASRHVKLCMWTAIVKR